MDYGRVPARYIKADCLLSESEYAAKSNAETVRKATPDDFAAFQPKKTLTVDICAELGLKRKPEKPVIPFEEMAVKSRLAETVKFERAVG